MHILIGICLALALLFVWLNGHWFGRVLAHLVFMPLLALGLAALFTVGIDNPGDPIAAIGGVIIGMTIGWFLASAPVYYQRRKVRQAAYRYELRKQELLALPTLPPSVPVERVHWFLR